MIQPLSPPPHPTPPKKKLHRHCFRFLLGHLHVPGEIANNGYTKLIWGEKRCVMTYYGICASGDKNRLRLMLTYRVFVVAVSHQHIWITLFLIHEVVKTTTDYQVTQSHLHVINTFSKSLTSTVNGLVIVNNTTIYKYKHTTRYRPSLKSGLECIPNKKHLLIIISPDTTEGQVTVFVEWL